MKNSLSNFQDSVKHKMMIIMFKSFQMRAQVIMNDYISLQNTQILYCSTIQHVPGVGTKLCARELLVLGQIGGPTHQKMWNICNDLQRWRSLICNQGSNPLAASCRSGHVGCRSLDVNVAENLWVWPVADLYPIGWLRLLHIWSHVKYDLLVFHHFRLLQTDCS